jgi:hypothetical protein
LQKAGDQKESECNQVGGDQELEEGGLEMGHGELSLGVVDDLDEQPDRDERYYDTIFDSALLEVRAGLYSDDLHGFPRKKRWCVQQLCEKKIGQSSAGRVIRKK